MKAKPRLRPVSRSKGSEQFVTSPKRGEQLNDVLLFRTEGEVADKNAHVLRGPGTKQWTDKDR